VIDGVHSRVVLIAVQWARPVTLCRKGAHRESIAMTDDERELLKRITANPEIFGGKPIIRDMRISVELVLSLLAQGETSESILEDYPDLEPEDIRACMAYAHAVIAHDTSDAGRIVNK
jgi:uncharacterized protein (DUF433 family)